MENKKKPSKLKSFVKFILSIALIAVVSFGITRIYEEIIYRKQKSVQDEVKKKYEEALNKFTFIPIEKEEEEIIEEPEPYVREIQPYFKELLETVNKDIVGVLKIEGTSIDYVVVQSKDNEYYLERDINGNKSVAGTIYLDYENDVFKQDMNTVLYGHNMRADIMFHSLRYYLDENYFKEHRYITFNTLYDEQKWEVFSAYRSDVKFPYTYVLFKSRDQFGTLLKQMKDRSAYDTGVEVNKNDRILTLSTCTNEGADDYRLVVNAKLIETTFKDPNIENSQSE